MSSRSKKKENTEKMVQDSQGISRKKQKHTFSPTLFIVLKSILILLIPILYFVYSPLLIIDLILYVLLFFIARLTEKTINVNIAKSSYIHIFKADSALALVVILVAIFGIFLSSTNKTKSSTFEGISSQKMEKFLKNFDSSDKSSSFDDFNMGGFPPGGGRFDFGNRQNSSNSNSVDTEKLPTFMDIKKSAKKSQIFRILTNLGSVLTGERNVFSKKSSFGIKEKPENFIKSNEEFNKMVPENVNFDVDAFEGFDKTFMQRKNNFSMDKIPLEYISSSTFSSINTILIFSVAIIGALSILFFILKMKKFNRVMNMVVIDSKIEILSDEEINRILNFGEDVDELNLSDDISDSKEKTDTDS